MQLAFHGFGAHSWQAVAVLITHLCMPANRVMVFCLLARLVLVLSQQLKIHPQGPVYSAHSTEEAYAWTDPIAV